MEREVVGSNPTGSPKIEPKVQDYPAKIKFLNHNLLDLNSGGL